MRATRQHHTGKIVPPKHGRLLDHALRHNDRARAHLGHEPGSDERHPVIGVVASRKRARCELQSRMRLRQSDESAHALFDAPAAARVERATSGLAPLVREDHLRATLGGFVCRGEPGGARANNEHVRMRVALRCCERAVRRVDETETRRPPDQPFPLRKPAAVKCLVVEAHRKEAGEPFHPRHAIRLETAGSVDDSDLHAGAQWRHIAAHVGHGAPALLHLEHRVHVMIRSAEKTARPVILERSPDHRHTVGGERRRNRVALEARQLPAFEAELER